MNRLPTDADLTYYGVNPSGEVRLNAGTSFRDLQSYWAGTIDKPHPDIPEEEVTRLREVHRTMWSGRATK